YILTLFHFMTIHLNGLNNEFNWPITFDVMEEERILLLSYFFTFYIFLIYSNVCSPSFFLFSSFIFLIYNVQQIVDVATFQCRQKGTKIIN
ncbi:hypothetical protein L9F63_015714, partial [Diploptera punctata]